ncbi:hypothetical protein AK830_g188 [Neonectria ditissima]|uniref:Uncharacterized protein n=1 Tax=Neonectria ditissima TaxID=78410 RepID=A0A0P7BWL6_9HYPO|nr:hypothetical protein AK830_g188 [Neonectria ditissima]
MSLPGSTLTNVIHHETYPGISPSRPEVSQTGRTVLVAGGTTGIGFSISQSFAAAGAAKVIIVGRRQEVLDASVAKIAAEYPGVKFLGYACDVADDAAVDKLWSGFTKDGILIDVLVICAAVISPAHTILGLGKEVVWREFVVNVKAPLDLAERFWKQKGRDPSRKLSLVYVSTNAAHDFATAGSWPNYSATKNSATLLLQQAAKDIAATDMQVISFNPGLHYTDFVSSAFEKDAAPWDDIKLPGDFAVWAASDEAQFLHGRFVWALWDVNKLKAGPVRERIDKEDTFLKVGIHGV